MEKEFSISQAEAEKCHKWPTQEQQRELATRSPVTVLTLTHEHHAIVEACTIVPGIHREPDLNQVKDLERKHITLLLNKNSGLLVPVVPIVRESADMSTETSAGYRMVPREIVNKVYKATKATIARAIENNNVETVDGKRRFILPSICLLPNNLKMAPAVSQPAATARGAAAAIGGSAAAVAAIAKSKPIGPNDAMEMVFKLQDLRCHQVMASTEIMDACRTDNLDAIPGIFLGRSDPLDAHLTAVPIDWQTADPQPSLRSQQLDLLSHALIETPLHFAGKFSVTAGKIPDSVTVPPEITAPASQSSVTSYFPPCPSDSSAMSTPAKRKPLVSAFAGQKRKDADPETPMPEPNGKRAVSDDEKRQQLLDAVRRQMTVFEYGPLSPAVHRAVYGDDVKPLGEYVVDAKYDDALQATGAGMHFSMHFHEHSSKLDAFLEFVKSFNKNGLDGIPASHREVLKNMSMTELLAKISNPGACNAAQKFLISCLAIQFLAGLWHGFLSADVNANLHALIDNIVLPLATKVDDLTATQKTLEATLTEKDAEIARLTELVAAEKTAAAEKVRLAEAAADEKARLAEAAAAATAATAAQLAQAAADEMARRAEVAAAEKATAADPFGAVDGAEW